MSDGTWDRGSAHLRAVPGSGSPLRFALGSDPEIGQRLLHDLRGDGEPIVYDLGAFYRYDACAGIYVPFPRPIVERSVHEYDGAWIPGSNGNEKPLRLTQSKIKGIVECAAAQAFVADFFAGAPPGVVFRNGFLSVTAVGIEFTNHSPAHRATLALPIDFVPGVKPARFLQFLEEVFFGDGDAVEKTALLQEHLGATLCGVAARYQVAIVALGTGANGKSVYIFIAIALLPRSAVTALPPQTWDDEYRIAMLSTSRLNAVSELPEGEVLASESVKAIITGDQVTGRHIRQAPFSFRPVAGHIFAANRLPGVTDHSHGFWRRFLPVEFNRVFSVDEQDKTLAETIIASELPGIAGWAVEGARRLMQQGRYTTPASSERARAQWRQGADQVAMFVEDRVTFTSDSTVTKLDMYKAYSEWARTTGHKALAIGRFRERLLALGCNEKRTARGRWWLAELVDRDAPTAGPWTPEQ